MKTFTTSKMQAVKLAKEILRTENGVARLSSVIVKPTSMQCGCGESLAYMVTANIGGCWKYESVGVCRACGK